MLMTGGFQFNFVFARLHMPWSSCATNHKLRAAGVSERCVRSRRPRGRAGEGPPERES